MAKNLKINIKNTQLAKAVNLEKLKSQLGKDKKKPSSKEPAKEEGPTKEVEESRRKGVEDSPASHEPLPEEEAEGAPKKRKIKARSRSVFAAVQGPIGQGPIGQEPTGLEEAHQEIVSAESAQQEAREYPAEGKPKSEAEGEIGGELRAARQVLPEERSKVSERKAGSAEATSPLSEKAEATSPLSEKEGAKQAPSGAKEPVNAALRPGTIRPGTEKGAAATGRRGPVGSAAEEPEEKAQKKPPHGKKVREFRDVRPKRPEGRRLGGTGEGEEGGWRRRRPRSNLRATVEEPVVVRPTELTVRLPITIKDLAGAMKIKSSQLIQKLFMQGLTLTLNDLLDDETTVQLLGQEFGCQITIDTSEEQRIRITDQTIREEIAATVVDALNARAPVVAFMGHVDHGKTSLIDRIRNSQIAAGEAGAITQHIGAFRCYTGHGPITILDTPGHEAFTSMRARGADVTDVVVLVIAGDEGMRAQTLEAIQHARAAGVTIVVAINKCDKPDFNADHVYRQLAEQELLPEHWGGTTIAVSCSAVTGEGIDQLLEMIALQAEVLELRASPSSRARGTVIESEMHTGMGVIATVLVQNGTLRHGDSIVIDDLWGRIKTMQDEYGKRLEEAPPSAPVAITGLSSLPMAGKEFIVVKDEKVAREIAETRREGSRQRYLQQRKRVQVESLLQERAAEKKVLNLILRADVQGSLEALRSSLLKIQSEKAELDVIFSAVGAISESDVELAAASKAVIIGFHTHVEAHAETMIKQSHVQVRLHDVIYHAIDDVRQLLAGTLEKMAEEINRGVAEVRATFKSSQLGIIAGCFITEGVIARNYRLRQRRKGQVIWTGSILSIRRGSDDVREVRQGLECGIVLDGQKDIQSDDLLEAFEITYVTQEL